MSRDTTPGAPETLKLGGGKWYQRLYVQPLNGMIDPTDIRGHPSCSIELKPPSSVIT